MDRFYRKNFNTKDRFAFTIIEKESDIFVISDKNIKEKARKALSIIRKILEDYIGKNPRFQTSLIPLPDDKKAHPIIRRMLTESQKYNVGPMAGVAGAVNSFLAREVDSFCDYLLLENGGDILIKSGEPVILSVFAGEHSPFTEKLKFKINPGGEEAGSIFSGMAGVCTSSGTVGPSLSLGNSDAVVIYADDCILSDVAATSLGNQLKSPENIREIIQREKEQGLLRGGILIIGEHAGIWGELELVP